jgi:nucleoside phosphorylase
VPTATVADSGDGIGQNEIRIIVTGLGPQKARLAVDSAFGALPTKVPDTLLVIGICGALTKQLPGDRLVVYTECHSSEGDKPVESCSPQLTNGIATWLEGRGFPCDRVRGMTSDRIATSPQQRTELASRSADVVDMESYPIIAAANRAGVPVAVVRTVSDSFDRKIPDFNRALKPDGDLDGKKAIRIAMASPIRTIRLLQANRHAIQELGNALKIVLPGISNDGTRH